LSEQTRKQATDRGQLAMILKRGWLRLIIGMLIGVLLALIVTQALPKTYTSSAAVLVTPTGVDDTVVIANARTNGTINLDTESQLVASTGVADRARNADPTLASQSSDDLLKNVTVSVPANTNVLTISYQASTPALAQEGARDFAAAYVAERAAQAQSTLNAQIAKITSNADALTKSLSTAVDNLTKLTGNNAVAATDPRVQLYQSQRDLITQQLREVNTQLGGLNSTVVTPGRVVSPASLPTSPSSPSKLLNVAAGLGFGVLIGLLAAWFAISRPRRMRDREDAMRLLRLPTVGALRPVTAGLITEPGTRESWEYLRVINVLRATLHDGGSVLVTGTSVSNETETVAYNLGVTLAREGSRVDIKTLQESMMAPVVRLAPVTAEQGIATDDTDHDWFIVDGPSPALSPITQSAAASCDAVILLVSKWSRSRAALDALEQLDSVAAPVLGVIWIKAGFMSQFQRDKQATVLNLSGSPVQNGEASSSDQAVPRPTGATTVDAGSTPGAGQSAEASAEVKQPVR
jgi:capsular polysaccharide biosynthesis protein